MSENDYIDLLIADLRKQLIDQVSDFLVMQFNQLQKQTKDKIKEEIEDFKRGLRTHG